MYGVKHLGVIKYVFDERPIFANGILRFPVHAQDINEEDSEIIVDFTGAIYSDDVVNIVKSLKKSQIKQAFIKESATPIVDTGLGFSVDGAYHNKTDFETGKKYSFPQVRASDNTMHDVTQSDYDTIITAIEMHGISLYQKKWTLEAQIDSAATLEELETIQW